MAFERVNPYRVRCNCCGQREIFYSYTLKDAIEIAEYNGWICTELKFSDDNESSADGILICPCCAKDYDD